MAVTVAGTPVVTASTADTTSFTVNLPTGLSVGDLIHIAYTKDGSAGPTAVPTISGLTTPRLLIGSLDIATSSWTGVYICRVLDSGYTTSGAFTQASESAVTVATGVTGCLAMPVAAYTAPGTFTSWDAPLVTWGAYGTTSGLAFASAGGNVTGGTFTPAMPSGYSQAGYGRSTGSQTSWLVSAYKSISSASSEDPGAALTNLASDEVVGITVFFPETPAGPYIKAGSVRETFLTSAQTSIAIDLPQGLAVNDMIVVDFNSNGTLDPTRSTATGLSRFALIVPPSAPATSSCYHGTYYAIVRDTGYTAQVTFTTESVRSCALAYAVVGATNVIPEGVSSAPAADNQVDPPNHSYGIYGTGPYLYVGTSGGDNDSTTFTPYASAGTNYNHLDATRSTGGGASSGAWLWSHFRCMSSDDGIENPPPSGTILGTTDAQAASTLAFFGGPLPNGPYIPAQSPPVKSPQNTQSTTFTVNLPTFMAVDDWVLIHYTKDGNTAPSAVPTISGISTLTLVQGGASNTGNSEWHGVYSARVTDAGYTTSGAFTQDSVRAIAVSVCVRNAYWLIDSTFYGGPGTAATTINPPSTNTPPISDTYLVISSGGGDQGGGTFTPNADTAQGFFTVEGDRTTGATTSSDAWIIVEAAYNIGSSAIDPAATTVNTSTDYYAAVTITMMALNASNPFPYIPAGATPVATNLNTAGTSITVNLATNAAVDDIIGVWLSKDGNVVPTAPTTTGLTPWRMAGGITDTTTGGGSAYHSMWWATVTDTGYTTTASFTLGESVRAAAVSHKVRNAKSVFAATARQNSSTAFDGPTVTTPILDPSTVPPTSGTVPVYYLGVASAGGDHGTTVLSTSAAATSHRYMLGTQTTGGTTADDAWVYTMYREFTQATVYSTTYNPDSVTYGTVSDASGMVSAFFLGQPMLSGELDLSASPTAGMVFVIQGDNDAMTNPRLYYSGTVAADGQWSTIVPEGKVFIAVAAKTSGGTDYTAPAVPFLRT